MKILITIFIILLFGCNSDIPTSEHQVEGNLPEVPVISMLCTENSANLIFDRKIKVLDNTLGYARVRSDDNYFHPGHNDNLIGNVKCGTVMNTFLPEIYRGMVDGMVESTRNPYYIVQLKDSSGNDCIGYIAGHVIVEIKN